MDGDTALKYARTRHQDSDFGRIARQQQVAGRRPVAVLNPINWPRVPAVAAAASTSPSNRPQPARRDRHRAPPSCATPASQIGWSSITPWSRPFTGDGGAFLLEPKAELRAGRRALPRAAAPTAASVEVLNGAGVAGLARTTADKLDSARLRHRQRWRCAASAAANQHRRPARRAHAPPNRSPPRLGLPSLEGDRKRQPGRAPTCR